MKPAYMINTNTVIVVKDGVSYEASRDSHQNFNLIVERIRDNDWQDIENLFNLKKAITQYSNGLVSIVDSVLHYDGEPLHDTLASRIIDMFEGGFDIKPMVNFLINLRKNPSRTAVQELYLFLETGKMPITEDGCFLAYKKVRDDFRDIYTGTMDNSPGQSPMVPRNTVDDNRDNTCSYGLHFCSISYLSHYGTSSSNKVVIVKINPANVVSIPSDYRNTKGRCWTYTVIGEYKEYKTSAEYFDKPVYTDNDFEDRGWHNKEEVSEDNKPIILDFSDYNKETADIIIHGNSLPSLTKQHIYYEEIGQEYNNQQEDIIEQFNTNNDRIYELENECTDIEKAILVVSSNVVAKSMLDHQADLQRKIEELRDCNVHLSEKEQRINDVLRDLDEVFYSMGL